MAQGKYLFGPVPSRRFGRSLGVDLVPFKTCSLDCVFCQLGRTTNKTVIREEYVSTDEVILELNTWLKTDGKADYITLAGSGEPTLHSDFGKVLKFIQSKCTIPTVLLTNGTLLHHKEVHDAASFADIVKVSLSAWDQASYGWVNRPHTQLEFTQLVEGQKAFRKQFRGELWLEVFLVAGMNTMSSDVRRIAALAEEIEPDRIQLNTVVRPPAEDFASPLSGERMRTLCRLFRPNAEVIAEFSTGNHHELQVTKETILAMLQRRPCTADHIAEGFGMHLNEVSKYLGNLIQTGQIRQDRKNGVVYYAAEREQNKGYAKV